MTFIINPHAFGTLVNTTTECSPNPGSTIGYTDFTIWDRAWDVDNDKWVTELAWDSTVAVNSITLYLSERIDATTYRTKTSVTGNHGGTGKEWFVLPAPFLVPSSGTFRVGVYPQTGAVATTRGSTTDAAAAGKASTTIDADVTVTENTNGAFSVCAQYAELQ